MDQPAQQKQPQIRRRAKAGPDDFVPKEHYVSPDFVRREAERLWPRTWQMACREQEIPTVGDYVTYDLLDESIIVVRTAADRISAYHNACQHRRRRLTDGCGHATRLNCRLHGWSWKLDGTIAHVVDRDNWDGSLKDEDIALPKVRVGSWGGWVFVCMSEDTEPLLDFLAPLPEAFRNYPFEKMRYRWYKSTGIPFPTLAPEEIARAGADWHLFPNVVFLPAPDAMLAYRARPDREDPERCIFEVYSLVLYPEGQEPPLERRHFADGKDHDGWGLSSSRICRT